MAKPNGDTEQNKRLQNGRGYERQTRKCNRKLKGGENEYKTTAET